jgi:hypothetical protein
MIVGTVPDEEFWADHHIVLGAVDVSKADLTRSRFQVRKVPALLYIHKGKVYRYPKADDYPFSWDTITRFVTEDYTLVDAEDVPDPRTWIDEAINLVNTIVTDGEQYFTMLGRAFGVMIVAVIINQVFFVKRTKKKNSTTKKKQN